MGRASRWLKSLFSGRKKDPSRDVPPEERRPGWSFAGRRGSSYREKPASCRHPSTSFDGKAAARGGEESRRAMAVAAATAAVAEAAVAAAEAAAVVVRLTNRASARRGEVWAAVRIQSVFRGYLARRALKALRGLVKIQALVRGYIVRKQAAETLRCMQALVRVQARARAGRVLPDAQLPNRTSGRHHYDPSKSERKEPRICVGSTNAERPSTLKRNASRNKNQGSINESLTRSPAWNWLDQWMEERYHNHDGNEKERILEVDAGRPHIKPKWRNRHHSVCSAMTSCQNTHSAAEMHDSPSKDSTIAQHSVLSSSSVELQQHFSSPLGHTYDGDSFYSCSRLGVPRSGPFTPAKSDCSQSFLSGFSENPNYMSYTESSKAKTRSHSAPRQRMEYDKSASVKRNLAYGCGNLNQPFSSSQRSFSLQLKFAGKTYPESGRLDKTGLPIKI